MKNVKKILFWMLLVSLLGVLIGPYMFSALARHLFNFYFVFPCSSFFCFVFFLLGSPEGLIGFFAIIALLLFSAFGVKKNRFWVPLVCTVFFAADAVFCFQIALQESPERHSARWGYPLTILLDLGMLVLFVLYFVQRRREKTASVSSSADSLPETDFPAS